MPKFAVVTKFTGKDELSPVFKRMGKASHRFGVQSEKSFNRFAKAAKVGIKAFAAGTVALVAAGSAAIIKTAEMGDEAAKTSRRLGITAESLQELRFAADRQGVSAGLLDSSFTALQKRVGELKAGTGSLFTFLNKTGDEAFANQLMNAKNTEEAFLLITKRAGQIENPMEKAAFASAAFSRAGVDMLKFMEAGQDGINALRQDARKYGAVISEDATKNSELFIDAMTNFKSAIGGVGKTLGTKLMPLATELIQKFADFWAANRKIITQGIDKFFKTMVSVIKQLKPVVFTLANLLGDVFDIIVFAMPFLKPFLGILLALKGAMILIGGALKLWAAAQAVLNIVMTANPIGLIVIGIAALIAAIVVLAKHWDKVTAAVQRAWQWFSKLLDNPLIAAAATIFAPFIAIPALIIKHWEPIKAFFSDVIQTAGKVIKLLSFVGGGGRLAQDTAGITTPDAPNTAQADATTNVNVDVTTNVNKAAPDTTVETKTRPAKGVNINQLGVQFGL